MKLLFYNHTGQVSGAERVLLMALARLDRARFDCLLVCPEPGPLLGMARELGTTCPTIDVLEARFTWRVDLLLHYVKSFYIIIRQLRRQIIGANPDIVHANSTRAGLVATAATVGLSVPVIWHLHDLLPRHPLSTAIRCVAGASARTRMIAVSHAVAQNFRGRILRRMNKRAPVRVIHNGIEADRFQPDSANRRAKRDELGLTDAQFVVGIVGQITPRKGQLELLGAFAAALGEVPHAVLLVVGAPLFNRDDEYFRQLTHRAGELGVGDRVRFLGQRRDVAGVMQAFDLLVVSSLAEPFGLVVIEAMASGTPVLATAVDGIPELIRHGENGWLVPSRDERALTAAIVHLSRQPNLRRHFAEQGGPYVRARFSAEEFVRKLENFYAETCSAETQSFGRTVTADEGVQQGTD